MFHNVPTFLRPSSEPWIWPRESIFTFLSSRGTNFSFFLQHSVEEYCYFPKRTFPPIFLVNKNIFISTNRPAQFTHWSNIDLLLGILGKLCYHQQTAPFTDYMASCALFKISILSNILWINLLMHIQRCPCFLRSAHSARRLEKDRSLTGNTGNAPLYPAKSSFYRLTDTQTWALITRQLRDICVGLWWLEAVRRHVMWEAEEGKEERKEAMAASASSSSSTQPPFYIKPNMKTKSLQTASEHARTHGLLPTQRVSDAEWWKCWDSGSVRVCGDVRSEGQDGKNAPVTQWKHRQAA